MVKQQLYIDLLDPYLLENGLINMKHRQLRPIVLQRQQLADSLARYMLGLERKAKTKTLQQLLDDEVDSLPKHDKS